MLILVPRLQFLVARVKKHVVLLLRIIVFVALRPVVADGVGKYLTASIERATRDRLLHLFRGLQLGACIFIPEAEATIGPNSGQRAMWWMERDVVHRKYVLIAIVGAVGSMAFEREIVLGVLRVHVMDGHASFDASQREAGRCTFLIQKYWHASMLVF